MRIIIFSSTFLFLFIASIASAQSTSHTEPRMSAPTNSAMPNDELVGTVTGTITYGAENVFVTEVALQNVGTSLIPTITVVVTNVSPTRFNGVSSSGWTCDNVEFEYQATCSTEIASLDAGASSTVRLELEILVPTAECLFDFTYPNGIIRGDPRTGFYEVCYERDLSPRAVAFTDMEDPVELVLIEPVIFHTCQCAFTEPWPTPTPLPTVQPTHPQSIPEPVTIVLFGLGVTGMAGYAGMRRSK